MRTRTIITSAALISVLAATAAAAHTRATSVTGTVGAGTISMNVKSVKAGKRTITVRDTSANHNFHLTGPGVNKSTTVGGTGTFKWTVTLKKGTYTFKCDVHPSAMKGTFKVT